MEALFEKNETLNEDVKRNILSLKKSKDLFDDLYDEPGCKEVAQAAEARIKKDISTNIISRGFHYTTGILFPFESENYQRTRFSDGSFGCWYGSLDLDTTIYETAFHNLKDVLGISGVTQVIYRERAIYNIHCQGILLDFRGQEISYPELIADDYTFTQQIGRRLATQGHPGLLTPSARKRDGVNLVALTEKILSNPRILHYLSYYINPVTKSVRVEKVQDKTYLEVNFSYCL